MTLVVNAGDLDTFLGLNGTIDTARADLVLGLVMDDAASIVDPLPDNGAGVILSAAARVFGNPQALSAQSIGPFSASHPPGSYLTRREMARLRRLAGQRVGAYTIDPTAADAGPEATWPELADEPWETA